MKNKDKTAWSEITEYLLKNWKKMEKEEDTENFPPKKRTLKERSGRS